MPSRPKDYRRTEQRNPASKNLDRMTAREIVRLMNREDRKVAVAVGRKLPAIARAVDAIVGAIRNGGRLIYVGAGSSGRMGVLDAAECPPTFGTSPKLVVALIAGGRRAITRAVEGAEDSERNGARDLRAVQLTGRDVVVGIAASGTTPYVVGALKYARKRGAMTVAVTSNLRMPVGRLAKIVIAPEVGNLMIDMMLTNKKLAERALRILAEASGNSVSAAEHALRAAGHDLRVALVILKLRVGAAEAKKRLKDVRGDLRKAIGE